MMQSATGKRKRERLRRVSRARILEGHPFRADVHAITAMVSAYVGLSAVISLLFSYFHGAGYTLVLWTLLPGAVLGYALLVMERLLGGLKVYMFSHMGKLLTAFLLFFGHIIGYLALSSIIVSYPLGYVMEKFWDTPGMAGQYSLFSANFFIVLAVLSWLRNMRTAPCRCL
jgi:hypothetical protein